MLQHTPDARPAPVSAPRETVGAPMQEEALRGTATGSSPRGRAARHWNRRRPVRTRYSNEDQGAMDESTAPRAARYTPGGTPEAF
ncbi:MAG: hypothetical protein H6Q28_116 [Bacteroidetes bacterium]|nr:hypothetical protein [Bacteroidota bacterium]